MSDERAVSPLTLRCCTGFAGRDGHITHQGVLCAAQQKENVMQQRIRLKGLMGFALAGVALLCAQLAPAAVTAGDITGGKKAPHINIAAFHTLHGQEGYKYPEQITDHDILHALRGKAQYIFMNHTSGLKDGDVISVATDVLRDTDGEFEDFGVDCQMTVHLAKASAQLSGICEVLMLDQDGRQIEHQLFLRPKTLEDGKDWVLLYYDAEDGIAIYANEEVGLE